MSSGDIAAWVQAIGSIAAILTAVAVQYWQRRKVLQDATTEHAMADKEHIRRLVAALTAEIREAIATAQIIENAINGTFAALAEARAKRMDITPPRPIRQGTMSLTDGLIYQQLAAEVGRLPPGITRSVVKFYATARNLERVAEAGNSAEDSYKAVLVNLPGFRMNAAIVLEILKAFTAADFRADADLTLSQDVMGRLAKEVGYPLDEVLKQRQLETAS